MEHIVPKNLEALQKANTRPNPINIAGYSQKSTHIGYLSWILNPYHNPLANHMVNILLLQLEENDYTYNFEQEHNVSIMDCSFNVDHIMTNCKIGAHNFDLLISLKLKDIPGQIIFAINIEVDDVSGDEKTYRELSSQLGTANECVGAIVFCIGTSSRLRKDTTWGDFTPIDFNNIYDFWKSLINSPSNQMKLEFVQQADPEPPKRFLVDWLESIGFECARAKLAHAYIIRKINNDDKYYNRYGYRGYDQPYAYIYPLLEDRLHSAFSREDKFNFNGFWIYEKHRFGSIFKFRYMGVGCCEIEEVPGLKYQYNFLNEYFQLNVINDEATKEDEEAWIIKVRQQLEQIGNIGSLEFQKVEQNDMRFFPVAQWKTDMTDLKQLASGIKNLVEQIEMRGILKGYDYGDRRNS